MHEIGRFVNAMTNALFCNFNNLLHFFCRYVNWSQRQFGIYDVNSSFYLGNQYAKFWKDVEEVRQLFC